MFTTINTDRVGLELNVSAEAFCSELARALGLGNSSSWPRSVCEIHWGAMVHLYFILLNFQQ